MAVRGPLKIPLVAGVMSTRGQQKCQIGKRNSDASEPSYPFHISPPTRTLRLHLKVALNLLQRGSITVFVSFAAVA